MDESIRDKVRIEQMRMLFETPLPGMLLATLFACALAWHMRGAVAHEVIASWLAVKFLMVVPRVYHAALFQRRRDDSLMWLRWGIALMVVDGLAWGSAGIFLMAPEDPSSMTVIAASLSGVAAIAAFALHADRTACAGFSSAMLVPMVLYFLWRSDTFGLYGAASISTFLALLLAAANRSERHVVELLALRFHNAALTGQLQAALQRTEEESHAKDVFLANMSHELRTPLHGILGLSRNLTMKVPSTEQETLSLIRKSGDHLLGLINNILEFSRFKARGIDMHPSEVDVVRLVEDAAALFRPNAQERRIDLQLLSSMAAPYFALVDPYRLRQILMNLVGNAIKFTEPNGSVTVRLVERHSPPGIKLTITDTGVGISPEAAAQLFEPFRQGDASATRRYAGTGLGLHITREICRAMGGDITYRSAPGKGATFEVTLPLERVAPVAVAPFAPNSDSGFHLERIAGGKVLLVEDNEVNALVAEAALQRLGVQVEHVTTGIQAVRRLCTQDDRPDLVLLDCQMPEMDGYEACRRVRRFETENGLSPVPIVALTANVFPQDRERCREAGMDGFLGKPFTERELHQILASFALVIPVEGTAVEGALVSNYAAHP